MVRGTELSAPVGRSGEVVHFSKSDINVSVPYSRSGWQAVTRSGLLNGPGVPGGDARQVERSGKEAPIQSREQRQGDTIPLSELEPVCRKD